MVVCPSLNQSGSLEAEAKRYEGSKKRIGLLKGSGGAERPPGPIFFAGLEDLGGGINVGGSIITNTIVGAPYYRYGIMVPQNPFLIIKAPILR